MEQNLPEVESDTPLESERKHGRRVVAAVLAAVLLGGFADRTHRALFIPENIGQRGAGDATGYAAYAAIFPPRIGQGGPSGAGTPGGARNVGPRVPSAYFANATPNAGGGADGIAPVDIDGGIGLGELPAVLAANVPVLPLGADVFEPVPGSGLSVPGPAGDGIGPGRGSSPSIVPGEPQPGGSGQTPGIPGGGGGSTPGNPGDGGPGVLLPDPGPGAVPEPSTWALMIIGLGLAGLFLRRQSRRQQLLGT